MSSGFRRRVVITYILQGVSIFFAGFSANLCVEYLETGQLLGAAVQFLMVCLHGFNFWLHLSVRRLLQGDF